VHNVLKKGLTCGFANDMVQKYPIKSCYWQIGVGLSYFCAASFRRHFQDSIPRCSRSGRTIPQKVLGINPLNRSFLFGRDLCGKKYRFDAMRTEDATGKVRTRLI